MNNTPRSAAHTAELNMFCELMASSQDKKRHFKEYEARQLDKLPLLGNSQK